MYVFVALGEPWVPILRGSPSALSARPDGVISGVQPQGEDEPGYESTNHRVTGRTRVSPGGSVLRGSRENQGCKRESERWRTRGNVGRVGHESALLVDHQVPVLV